MVYFIMSWWFWLKHYIARTEGRMQPLKRALHDGHDGAEFCMKFVTISKIREKKKNSQRGGLRNEGVSLSTGLGKD